MADFSESSSIDRRYQDAKKLFGFAVAKDTAEVYAMAGKPDLKHLGEVTAHQLTAGYVRAHGTEPDARDLLEGGIADTGSFITRIIDLHPHFTFEQSLSLARHERTIQSLARFARQDQFMMGILLHQEGTMYDMNDEATAIETADHFLPNPKFGCPVVEIRGDVKPRPIFNRFVPWAGELALRSYFDHHAA